jgi:hypothetical protein
VNDPCNISNTSPANVQVAKNGTPIVPTGTLPAGCTITSPTGTADKFDIVGFASLKITGVWRGNQAQAADPVNGCGAVPGFSPDPNAECLVAEWEGYQSGGEIGGGGSNFGEGGVGLAG